LNAPSGDAASDEPVPTESEQAPAKKSKVWLRLLLLAVLLVGIFLIGRQTGLIQRISVTWLQTTVRDAGPLGVAVYALLFAAGVLVQVPGMLFVAAGMLVYGKIAGYFVCLLGAVVAVCASFLMVRVVGGQALGTVKKPWIAKLLAKLDDHPVRWLVVLRLVAFISPPLNYALALTRIRFRDYALGSALGLVLPMAVVTLAFDWLFATEWVNRLLFG